MKVNVAGLRFIADVLEMNTHKYSQNSFGESWEKPEVAGTGFNCDTPACVAGVAVQFLGDEEGLRKHQKWAHDNAPIAPFDYKKNFDKLGLTKYAQELLGLPEDWTRAMFDYASWPSTWCRKNNSRITPNRWLNGKLKEPNAEQAATFLRKLAEQFEQEQGANVNKEHARELVEVQ